jgi:1,4-alpha-glucan branching enzyme
MLYLDYSKKDWIPNKYGGNENLEAIEFIKHTNAVVHAQHPGVMMIAEESTAWPNVSRPTDIGGLGFGYKWNMGWMHDMLFYLQQEPVHRRHHHDKLTFSIVYAFSENFILSLSHDEVVHLKKSLLGKMPGNEKQQFANLRLLYAFMYGHPGKKLLFMGGEFGQSAEWNHDVSLDWHLLGERAHAGIQRLVHDLNRFYRATPALHDCDFDGAGFEWIDHEDAQRSVLSFVRRSRDRRSEVVVVCNLTPAVHRGYRLGVPAAGVWRERLNTDSEHYGGSNVGCPFGVAASEPVPWQGQVQSVVLELPPLATVYLERER